MTDNVNHPDHYTRRPLGTFAECIEYTRPLRFSQGNAFKYVYRAGAKGNRVKALEDLDKALWYIQDAADTGQLRSVYRETWGHPVIDGTATLRSAALLAIAKGQVHAARVAIAALRDQIDRMDDGEEG